MVFSLSALWWRRVRGLWKLPDGRNWLKGKLVRVLMGGTMLSKSLIQFSVDGWGCVPSLLFTWGQTMVEVMKIMVTSFKRSYAWTATLSAPNPAASHWPMPPPETPGHLQASLGKICEYYINIQWTWVWVNSGIGDGQGDLACCSPWGHKESDATEWLNWNEHHSRNS